jgi:hypothetical protein
MVYSRAESVFILEPYFKSKSFAAVREAFSNAYSDNEVGYRIRQQYTDCNKISGHMKCLSVTSNSPDDEGSKHLWNVGKLLPNYTS